MTSIGNSEFPEMTFSEALKIIEGIKREKVQTTTALGGLMGLKTTNTGYFYAKLSALSKFYGLIDRSKANISLTPLGKRIVYPESDGDRSTAIRDSILNVDLTRRLFDALGVGYHELDFGTKLREVSGAEHDELELKKDKVEALYRDAIQYLKGVSTTSLTSQALVGAADKKGTFQVVSAASSPASVSTVSSPQLSGDPENFWVFQSGGSMVRIEKKNPKLLQTAKRVIDAWLFAEGVVPEEQP
jgi:hypothetical protein